MSTLADYTAVGCPSHAELALALASEFHPVDDEAAAKALDDLEKSLGSLEEARPLEQLSLVARTVAGRIRLPDACPEDDGDFLLDAVLVRGMGQPVMLAVLAAEIARRRGLRIGIVSDGSRHFVAHHDAKPPFVGDFTEGRLRHPRELGADLRWMCGHQVACAVLHVLLARAKRRGELLRAASIAELKLELPFDAATRGRAHADVAALRAPMN